MEVDTGVEDEKNMFTSIFNTSQFKPESGFRLGGYLAALWGASISDIFLAFIVNAALRKGGNGVCFYSTLGGIHVGSGRYTAGGCVAGINIYDKFREDTDDLSVERGDLRHAAAMVVGFVAGKFMPKYFGKGSAPF